MKQPAIPLPKSKREPIDRSVRSAVGNLNRWIERNERALFNGDSDLWYQLPAHIDNDEYRKRFLAHLESHGWIIVSKRNAGRSCRIRLKPPPRQRPVSRYKKWILPGIVIAGVLVALWSLKGC